MNLPIEKQTVLITGAGRGLGAEIAKSFHREGAKVVINYRNSFESAKKLSDSLGENVILIKGDIREKVWNTMHPKERENDSDKLGFAVLIRLERATQLSNKPLSSLPGPS